MDYCIYKTDDEYKARMVIDILKKHNIITFSKNLGIQNLHGDSKLFTGCDLIVGEIKIYVKENGIEYAKQIVRDVPFLKNKITTIENDDIKKKAIVYKEHYYFQLLHYL
jgi:hypothetical protein